MFRNPLSFVFAAIAAVVTPHAGAELPRNLSLLADPDTSVYAPVAPPSAAGDRINAGAVNLDLTVRYLNRYVFRGLELFNAPGTNPNANLQFDGRIEWDLGKLPHPYIGAFVNVANSDPVNTFQEIRPVFGATWNLKPFTFDLAHVSYLYPDRSAIQTAEVAGRITFDDSGLFDTRRPVLSPFVAVAYDYDLYKGFYLTAGIEHTLPIESTSLSLTLGAQASFALSHDQFRKPGDTRDTGPQSYLLSLTARYAVNEAFNLPRRYGTWSLEGYLHYTGPISDRLQATSHLYGGVGINFRY